MNIGDVLRESDVDFDNAFIEYIDGRIGESAGPEQIQAWESLPELFKQYHALFALDSEVFNGGFGQYFRAYSSNVPLVTAALHGLGVVSPTHAKLAREAVSIYVHYWPNLQPVMQSFAIPTSPKLSETDIDQRFRDAGDLQELRISWLEANRDAIREAA